jgi:hypothetical protein
MLPFRVPILFLCFSCLPIALAQETTRTQLIEKARDEKSAHLVPDNPSTWEQRLIWIKDAKVLERISYGIGGLRVALGQMGTGGGFALGPDYLRQDLLRGNFTVHAAAYASTGHWTKLLAEASAPGFGSNKLFWDFSAVRHDYNSIHFYGPGPESEKHHRSNFRYEDFAVDTNLGVRPVKFLRFGASIGHLRVNTGPGQDEKYISSELAFPSVVGIQQQTNFHRWGGFLQID